MDIRRHPWAAQHHRRPGRWLPGHRPHQAALGYTLSTGDYYAAAIPLALAIGRVGCFLSELPLGTPTDLPWGMTVSPEAAAASRAARLRWTDAPEHAVRDRFPARRLRPDLHPRAAAADPGDTLKAYLLAYGIFRFGVEFVRGNEVQALGLTGPQIVLIPLVGLLVIHFVRRLRSGAYRLPIPEPAIARGG